jgi:hypothetical protein
MTNMELLQNLQYHLSDFITFMADRKLKLHLDYNGLTTSYVSDIEYWRLQIEWDKGLLTKIKEWLREHHGKLEREDWVRYTQTSNKQTENGKVFM